MSYCPKCDKLKSDVIAHDSSVGISVLEREVWNAAIEAAAQYLEKDNWKTVPNQVRELKK